MQIWASPEIKKVQIYTRERLLILSNVNFRYKAEIYILFYLLISKILT